MWVFILRVSYLAQHFKDRYVISNRVLGGGFYGTVYLAQEVENAKQVACKIIDIKAAARQLSRPKSSSEGMWDDEVCMESVARQKVFREIRILAKLSHVGMAFLFRRFAYSP